MVWITTLNQLREKQDHHYPWHWTGLYYNKTSRLSSKHLFKLYQLCWAVNVSRSGAQFTLSMLLLLCGLQWFPRDKRYYLHHHSELVIIINFKHAGKYPLGDPISHPSSFIINRRDNDMKLYTHQKESS